MEKAILILNEMPKGCNSCPLRAWTERSGEPYCTVGPDDNFLHYEDNFDDTPPEWCPLGKLPEPKTMVDVFYSDCTKDCFDVTEAYRKGWNDCLGKIIDDGQYDWLGGKK